MLPPLSERFFQPSAEAVAPLLLGHWLIRNSPDGPSGGPIVEAEAYLKDDPACHAFGGPTARNHAMWGAPGRAYVYLIYGYHFCVNVVCCAPGVAEAVLIRAIEPVIGEEFMRKNRPLRERRELTNGPAKLCAALNIDRRLDGATLCVGESALWIGANPKVEQYRQEQGRLSPRPRVGIAKKPPFALRFYLAGGPFVSHRPESREPCCSQPPKPDLITNLRKMIRVLERFP